MKKTILGMLLCFLALIPSFGQKKSEIVKTGLNFGPLPVVAFDADKGLQLGALLNIFNFGDGSTYPNYMSKLYFEASFFTKGSQLYTISYDNKNLIPGVRWSSAISLALDKGMDFYGFNGYQSFYDWDAINKGKAGESFIFSPYYKFNRTSLLAKTDFIGNFSEHFHWEAGYHGSWFKTGAIDRKSINKGKEDSQKFPDDMKTLYEKYVDQGIISEDEAYGGYCSVVRLGLMYDSRDKEGAPSKGIWAEGHLSLAPKWLGTKNPYYRYSLTFRHYVPIVKDDKLTFAYRLNYEGTFGSKAPFYVLPYITLMGEGYDRDGFGGYRTIRGILRDRVVGLDNASYNAEIRWRFVKFALLNQNISLALNAFSDGAVATRSVPITENLQYQSKDKFHITLGAGFRFIMNENFIVAAEYGTPVSHLYKKTNPLYNQDGTGAFYLNIGYLF